MSYRQPPRTPRPVAWLVPALVGLAACGRPTPALRVGFNPWPGYEVLSLAAEQGFYRAEGVDVRVIEFNSLADERRAYERGQIDVLASTVIEVLQARDQSSRSPQIVQVVDYSNGADMIVAHGRFADVAALRGARIGVELASLGIYILARALARHGLAIGDVKMISMDQLSMESGFRSGELDAVVTYPPTSVKLLRAGDAHVVFSTREIPHEVVDVLAVEQAIAAQRPDDVARFLRAYQRGLTYTRQHPADAYRAMAAREGITASEFAAALTDGLSLVDPADQAAYLGPGGSLAKVIEDVDRVLRDTGQIAGADRRAGVSTAAFIAPGPLP